MPDHTLVRIWGDFHSKHPVGVLSHVLVLRGFLEKSFKSLLLWTHLSILEYRELILADKCVLNCPLDTYECLVVLAFTVI